ncbi:MAG: TetR/AcrR family transcriptional regulator [Hyphomonadaceae bacterium]
MATVSKYNLRRDAIIRVATDLMNHKGVRGMTHALVAAELDLVPRAVGYYFRRKEDLAAACYARSIERLDTHISEALKQVDPAETVRAFVQLFFESQRQVVVEEIEPVAWFEELRTLNDPSAGRTFTDMFRKVRSIFSMEGAPSFQRVECNARAHLLLSQMFWAVLWLPRYNPEDYARMGERTADILLNGMAGPNARWPPPTLMIGSDDEVERDFLTAGTELINENGYLGASVEKIAARLNVTKGAFYHHNETKNELVEQCFERTWAILREAQQKADMAAPDAFMNLAAQANAMVGGQVSGKRPLLRTSALAAAPEEMRPRLMAGFDRITARYASVVCDGIGDGSIRPLDAPTAAQILSGTINAAAELPYWAPGLTPRTAEQHYVRAIFTGLLSGDDAPATL